MTPSISLVIPALNEETGISATIARAPSDLLEVIVVDGGSKDGTVERAEAAGARVIVERRRGYGLAYKVGFDAARGELIATADADGTYPVEMIPRVADFLANENLWFVSCSRFPLSNAKSMPFLNKFGNAGLSVAATLLYLHTFRDISSGMWVFRRSLLGQLDLGTDGWCFSNEIKLEAFYAHPDKFAEYVVPYDERVGPTHNLTIWRTGFEVLGFMTYKRLRHFARSRLARPRSST